VIGEAVARAGRRDLRACCGDGRVVGTLRSSFSGDADRERDGDASCEQRLHLGLLPWFAMRRAARTSQGPCRSGSAPCRYGNTTRWPLEQRAVVVRIRDKYAAVPVTFPLRVLLALLVVATAAFAARAQGGATSPAAASALFERFVGAWRTETLVRDATGTVIARTFGTAAGMPTLGGRWLEFRTASTPAGAADLQIMTWDADARVYRQWLFDADGYWHTAIGTFEPALATLTWRGEKDGVPFVIEDRWASPDRLTWTLRRTSPDGRVLETMSGTLVRADR
jgi:hypothetical protein